MRSVSTVEKYYRCLLAFTGDLGLVTRWALLIRMGAMRRPEDRISYPVGSVFCGISKEPKSLAIALSKDAKGK